MLGCREVEKVRRKGSKASVFRKFRKGYHNIYLKCVKFSNFYTNVLVGVKRIIILI